MKLRLLKKRKKADSLMVSYVLLISIVIGISIGVFAWLKYTTTDIKPEINCEIGTSVIVESYSCDSVNGKMILTIKNNGLFNVNGVNVKVSNDPAREPITGLDPGVNGAPGIVLFGSPLEPNDESQVSFGRTSEITTPNYPIKVISVQPIVTNSGNLIYCSNAVIKENLVDCEI